MSTDTNVARRAWTLFEPIHAIVYFAPESRPQYDAVGLRGGWMGYFASRSAPMGAVGPEVVTAVFHNFAPVMVHRAIPDAWRFATPERVLGARLAAADGALRRMWGDEVDSENVAEAASLAVQVCAQLRPDGRPLFAGHAGLPVPDEPHLALWHACSLLREHRFDGHVAALTGYGVDGIDALLLQVGTGRVLDAPTMRAFRGWTDAEWADAQERMRGRGFLDEEGHITPKGGELRSAVERVTDALAAQPWERVDATVRDRLLELLAPLAARVSGEGGMIFPNPIGLERPAAAS